MITVTTGIFLACAVATALASLATMLMTPRPACPAEHVQQLARLGVFAAGLWSAARVLMDGTGATWERALLMASLAALYGVQMLREIHRQQRRGVSA